MPLTHFFSVALRPQRQHKLFGTRHLLTHSLTRLYFQSKVNKQPENQVAKNTTVSAAVLCSAVFVGHLINKAGLIVLANVLNTSQTKIFHGLTVV